MIKVAVQLVLDNVPNGKKKTLDTMAKQFHKKHRQTIRKLYPATDFSHGVTKQPIQNLKCQTIWIDFPVCNLVQFRPRLGYSRQVIEKENPN
jgi:hypothetical protein